jgi:hypothetical protein
MGQKFRSVRSVIARQAIQGFDNATLVTTYDDDLFGNRTITWRFDFVTEQLVKRERTTDRGTTYVSTRYSNGSRYFINSTERTPDGTRRIRYRTASSISDEVWISTYAPSVRFNGRTAFTHVGTTTDQGREVARYEAVFEKSETTTVSHVAYVDHAGMIRYWQTTWNRSEGTGTMTHHITDLNQTTVEEPAWIDDAREKS